jgi:hypothetical protein
MDSPPFCSFKTATGTVFEADAENELSVLLTNQGQEGAVKRKEFLVHLKLQHLPFDSRTRSEKYDVKNDQMSCRWCNETSSELKSGRCLQAVFTVLRTFTWRTDRNRTVLY